PRARTSATTSAATCRASARAPVARGTTASSSAVVSARPRRSMMRTPPAYWRRSAARDAGHVVQVADAAVLMTDHEQRAAVFDHQRPRGGSDAEDRDPVLVVHVPLLRRQRPERLV